MKVLFITRKYPPQIGGMERYSYDLINSVSCEKKVIALKYSQIHLLWFIPYAFLKGIFLSRKVDLIYLCDSLLGPLGLLLKFISKKPVLATAHGLDIVYNNWIYKNINLRSLKYLDKIIAVSRSTYKKCLEKDINSDKCVLIPNGINIEEFKNDYKREDLSKFLNFNTKKRKILLSLGRLVERKGIVWFIKNVMPKLDDSIVYLVAGQGPEEKKIKEAVVESGTMNQVIILGNISDSEKEMLYQAADIFIMPNIKIKNDKEGFGITSLEASCAGLPVVASNIEGIADAIKDKKNGYLIATEDENGYVEKINNILNSKDKNLIGDKFGDYTKEQFDWKKIIFEYEKEFKNVLTLNS